MSTPLLEVANLSVSYGRVEALRDVTLRIEEGQIVAVLGANGAGKSTLLLSIIGAVKPVSGDIYFAGAPVTSQPMHRRVGQGIVLVPEGRQILISMTIEENLLLGAHLRTDTKIVRREIEAIYDRFPNLATRKDHLASCLSGGEQQMLAVGRAMLAKPRLLMMDEPSLGLSPLFISRLFDLIREFNRDGLSILLIEQNTGKALSVAHHAVVLELGRVALAGDPAELASDPRLQEAYLGGAATSPQP
jgi:branched-chain amino acid transport system ATP-binding protein